MKLKVKKEMFFQKILMFVLIGMVLFLTGCSDENGTEKELYAGGWILHNINDNTPTIINFDYNNIAEYNFSYGFPGYSPSYYSSIFWFMHPAQGIAVASNIPRGNPLKQTLYSYVSNPFPDSYNSRFNIDKSVYLNFLVADTGDVSRDDTLQFAYDTSSEEVIYNYNLWDSLDPLLKEKKEFSFGHAPYLPGSIGVDVYNGRIYLRNYLLNGKEGMHIIKQTIGGASSDGVIVSYSLENPSYKIYENRILISERNITHDYYSDSGELTSQIWDERYFDSPHISDNKNYLVEMVIPAYYPVFNKTIVSAEFSTSQIDKNPPYLDLLEISPVFNEGQNINLNFRAKDDQSVPIVKAYFKSESSDWMEINLINSENRELGEYSNSAAGNFAAYGEKIDLKIQINDSSGNSQKYEIYPVSLKEKTINIDELKITRPIIDESSITNPRELPELSKIVPGDIIGISGYVRDNNMKGIGGILLEGFNNGISFGKKISSYSSAVNHNTNYVYWDKGFFYYEYQVPVDSSEKLNITFTSSPVGIYNGIGFYREGDITRYEHDIMVMNIQLPERIYVKQPTIIKSKIANVGKNPELAEIIFRNNYQELERRNISLNPNQISEEEFSFMPIGGDNFLEVIAENANDENLNNNQKNIFFKLVADKDVSGQITSGYNYYINYSNITLKITNNGRTEINNITYSLGIANQSNYKGYEETLFVEIDSGNISKLGSGKNETIISNAKLKIPGFYMLRLNATSSEDQNPNNDISIDYIGVKNSGSEFSTFLSNNPNFIMNESSILSFGVWNLGNLKSQNTIFNLYYSNEYCDYIENCENSTLLESRSIQDLEPINSKEDALIINFTFIPESAGYVSIFPIINSSNKIEDKGPNWGYTFDVKENGPDLYASFYNQEYIKGKENKVRIRVYNQGTLNSSDFNISLYEVEEKENYKTTKNLTFIGFENSSGIEKKGFKEFEIPWIPSKTGEHILKVEVSSQGDVYEENNYEFNFIDVFSEGIDIFIKEMYIEKYPIIGRDNFLYIILRNYGLMNSRNFGVNFYDNNILFYNKIQSILPRNYNYVDTSFNPTEKGNHILKAEANISDDDLSNNVLEKNQYFYNLINISINIKNSTNGKVDRRILSDFFSIDKTQDVNIVEVPDLSETNERFNLGIFNFIGENEGIAVIYNSSFTKNISIISDYYNYINDKKDYYVVFANDIDTSLSRTQIEIAINDIAGSGIVINDNTSIFYCVDFNFANISCDSNWEEVVDSIYVYKYDNSIYFSGEVNQRVDAVALSEMEDFDGESSNLKTISGVVSNLILEKSRYGSIQFLEEVNVGSTSGDLSSKYGVAVKISSGKISIDSTITPELKDVPARLLFKGINMHNPQILKDGLVCSNEDCSNLNYDFNSYTFSSEVNGFSEYRLVEGAYCGDSICNSAESCSICIADCGQCYSPTTGGRTKCTPKWENCGWGLCKSGVQQLECIDSNKCNSLAGKPYQVKLCLIEENCIDNDRDGYGEGVDCLGMDLNDNDPSVETNIPLRVNANASNESTPNNFYSILFWFLIAIILLGLMVIIAFIIINIRKEKETPH